MPQVSRKRDGSRTVRSRNRKSIERRIQDRYQELSPAERRLADLILNFPGELASYTATELAELADVSKAAATRLFQRLGYESYEQARRQARDAQRWGSPLYLQTRTSDAEDLAVGLEAHTRSDLANLTRTLEALRREELSRIVDAIATARRVVLIGFRNSYMLAAYTRWQLIQVRDQVLLLPVSGETLAEHLSGLTHEDVLIAIGFRRRLPALRRSMEAARNAGAEILYVTDPTASRTARLATWTIRCQVQGASLFDSYTAAISVLHYLSTALVNRLGDPGRSRLKQIERLHEALREFG